MAQIITAAPALHCSYPLNKYPFISTQPAASPASAWQAGFDAMNVNKINVLFVAKEAASPELLAYLATLDVAMIGSQVSPGRRQAKMGGDHLFRWHYTHPRDLA